MKPKTIDCRVIFPQLNKWTSTPALLVQEKPPRIPAFCSLRVLEGKCYSNVGKSAKVVANWRQQKAQAKLYLLLIKSIMTKACLTGRLICWDESYGKSSQVAGLQINVRRIKCISLFDKVRYLFECSTYHKRDSLFWVNRGGVASGKGC